MKKIGIGIFFLIFFRLVFESAEYPWLIFLAVLVLVLAGLLYYVFSRSGMSLAENYELAKDMLDQVENYPLETNFIDEYGDEYE